MTAGFPAVPPVRKKLRSVGPSTPAHIFDGVVRNTRVSELKSNERSEVAVRLCATPNDHRAAVGSVLDLTSHVFANLERVDPDVRTDRNDELGRVVRKGIDGARHDPGDRATPASVRRSYVPARRVREQHGDAVGRSRGDPDPFDAGDQRIALLVGSRFGEVARKDGSHPGPVDLSLLEQTVDTKSEASGEAGSVFADGGLVVAQVEAQVEAVVRRDAHSADARGKPMSEPVPIQKRGA